MSMRTSQNAWSFTHTFYLFDDEIEVEAKCTGYSDPGRYCGAPENCYPAEGDDEREIVSVKCFGVPIEVTPAVIDKVMPFIDDEDITDAIAANTEDYRY